MSTNYIGNYSFNYLSVNILAPDAKGVYYCGTLDSNGSLTPYYIGRAIGEGVSIKSRLINHLSNNWLDVTHFGYIICQTIQEAINLERIEIYKFQPKYNKQGLII